MTLLRNPAWEQKFLQLALLEKHEKTQAIELELA